MSFKSLKKAYTNPFKKAFAKDRKPFKSPPNQDFEIMLREAGRSVGVPIPPMAFFKDSYPLEIGEKCREK